MPTIFISANDTGAGKTWVTASLAASLAQQGSLVEVVKPVETGVAIDGKGDAEWVLESLPDKVTLSSKVNARTLRRYSKPMAPVDAARFDGVELDMDALIRELRSKQDADWLIVEGAGGLAVPLEAGPNPRDWVDFAKSIQADFVVLVVEDRLGAINQARLLASYAKARQLNAGWWLNEACSGGDAEVREINTKTLQALDFPLWAVQDHGAAQPRWMEAPWLN